jgi:hypothetical protein
MTANNTNKTVTPGIVKTLLSIQGTQFNAVHGENQLAYGMTQVQTCFSFSWGGEEPFSVLARNPSSVK